MYFLGLFFFVQQSQVSPELWYCMGKGGNIHILKPRLSVPDFVSQLWRSKLRDKIWNGEPGFEHRNSIGIQLNIHNILSRILLKFPSVANSQIWCHWYSFFFFLVMFVFPPSACSHITVFSPSACSHITVFSTHKHNGAANSSKYLLYFYIRYINFIYIYTFYIAIFIMLCKITKRAWWILYINIYIYNKLWVLSLLQCAWLY